MVEIHSEYLQTGPYKVFTRRTFKKELENEIPVIFIHGLAVSGRYVIPLAQRLGSYHNVWFPDLPGFGRSSKTPHVLNITEMADWIAGWMDTIRVKKAVFLANSMGCQWITDMALRYPGHIEKMVLLGPTMDPECRSLFLEGLRLFGTFFYESFCLKKIVIEDFFQAGVVRTYKTAQYGMEDKIEERLPLLNIPSLIISGDKDLVVPETWLNTMVNLLPKARVIVLKKEAHVVHHSAPDKVADLVREFIKGELKLSMSDAGS